MLTRLDTLRALRLSTWEAVWATAWMMLTAGSFQIGFARHLGASDFMLGLLAGLPAAVGLLQLPASLYVEKRGERRRFVGINAFFGRLCWLPILLIPFVLPKTLHLPAFLLLLVVSSALLTITVPAWTSWMSDLVPAEIRGRYFGQRNMLAGIVTMVVPLPAGWFLDLAVQRHLFAPRIGFATLFGIGVAAAAVTLSLILRVAEPPMARKESQGSPLRSLKAPLEDANFRRFLAFSCAVVMGQALAGQFFTAWQIDEGALHLPYLVVQIFGGLAAAAGLATGPLWGYLADKFGARPILIIASWGVLTAPLFWFFTVPGATVVNALLIVALNVLSGAFWAAVGLTQFNLLLRLTPDDGRPTYVAVFSAITGIVGALSPIAGGALMTAMAEVHLPLLGMDINNFKVMFLLTDGVRLGAVLLLRAVHDAESRPTREVLGQIVATSSVTGYRTLRRLSRPAAEAERTETVRALGEIKTPLAVEELIGMLDDVSPEVRESAARALGEIRDPRAVAPLAAKLDDPAAGIGEAAAYALGFLGDRSATSALVHAVRGPDASIRIAALRALARLRDPAATPALIETLQSAHPTRCEAACNALAAVAAELDEDGAAPAIPRLLALLSPQTDRGMRLAAARTLEAFGPLAQGAGDTLTARLETENDPAVIARLAGALARIGRAEGRPIDALLPVLLSALDRTQGHGLAYKQAIGSLADTLLEPGTFYPYLGMAPMERDEAVSRLLAGPERAPALEAFTRGEYTQAINLLADLVPHPALKFLARRAAPPPEEAVLAAVLSANA